MSAYVEALSEFDGPGPSLFLAGGITGCPDWQSQVVPLLAEQPLTLLNPRRTNFPIHDPSASVQQIEWEHRHLHRASAILFWFPCETLCPITLYELGAWSMTSKPLFVGTHSDYRRRLDVVVQTWLARPTIEVASSLEALADQVKEWSRKLSRPAG
jgi:hypothetical protein